jgi:hypothetical protein
MIYNNSILNYIPKYYKIASNLINITLNFLFYLQIIYKIQVALVIVL